MTVFSRLASPFTSLLGLNAWNLECKILEHKSKRLSEVFMKFFSQNTFCKLHFAKHIKSHQYTFLISHISQVIHFAKNPKSFSMQGLIIPCLDYWDGLFILSIWEYSDSFLLLRPLNTMQSFSTLASFTPPCSLFLHGCLYSLYAHNS